MTALPERASVLIVGCGYVGSALASRLVVAGHRVFGLKRSPDGLPKGVEPIAADVGNPATLNALPGGLDAVCYCVSAGGFTESAYRAAYVDGLRNTLEALRTQNRNPRRVVFTSSTGVYAQNNGEWVDEDTPTEPTRFSGQRLLEGEAVLADAPWPSTAVRLGGIYGPGRTRLIDSVKMGMAQCVEGRTVYLNLIHRDDCAGALAHVLSLNEAAPCYAAVDNEPVEKNALLRWVADRLGQPAPPTVSAEETEAPQRGGNRRVRNARLVESGYAFEYPTYREGYAPLL